MLTKTVFLFRNDNRFQLISLPMSVQNIPEGRRKGPDVWEGCLITQRKDETANH